MRTVASCEPEASSAERPAGWKARQPTRSPWPWSTRLQSPRRASHSRTALSEEPVQRMLVPGCAQRRAEERARLLAGLAVPKW